MKGTGPHRFCGSAKSPRSLQQPSTNSAIKAVDRDSGRQSQGNTASTFTQFSETSLTTGKKGNEAMTKSIRVAITFVASVALAATAARAQSEAQKSFNQLKSLTGTWEGKTPDGKAVEVSFRDTAGGSALMSEISGYRSEEMITMFHLDGANRLMMTHYCGAGNQPRMQASASPDGKTLTFKFVDATNLESPESGHMDHVVIALLDPNHHTEEWTFTNHGKEMNQVFDLRRKN